MKVRRLIIATSFMLLFVAVSCAQGPGTAGTVLHGVVVDASGAVISGAELKVIDLKGAVAVKLVTAADGSFQFSTLPVGEYTIEVLQNGFAQYTTHWTCSLALPASTLRIVLSPASN